MGVIHAELTVLADRLQDYLASVKLDEPELVLKRQIDRNYLLVKERIDVWQSEIKSLQTAEHNRIGEIIARRRGAFSELASPLLHRLKTGDLSLAEATDFVEKLKTRLDRENSEILVPYIGALESLRDSIDLHNLATAGIEELSELRVELDRLNSLAQLGIAVEIVGHELQAFDEIIATGLRNLPEEIRTSRAAKDIEFGHEGLTDQLRFLSPLRLAGQRVDRWISGAEIRDYISEFFSLTLTRNKIRLVSTDAFSAFRVFDQQSRLFPVFINLVNNAIYWASLGSEESSREILLSVVDGRIVVSESGPGVTPEDVQHLFSLFFTKRARGGRGVGLYLSRANLAAGGHRISYATDAHFKVLQGANFVIELRGAEFA
nr:ATP-binding protein [Brevundimonas sp. BAL450]